MLVRLPIRGPVDDLIYLRGVLWLQVCDDEAEACLFVVDVQEVELGFHLIEPHNGVVWPKWWEANICPQKTWIRSG